MNIMVTEAEVRQQLQLRPDGSSASGDDNLAIARAREAKAIASGSIGSPNWSGTVAAADDSYSYAHNDALNPQDRPGPPVDDVPDDIVTTTTTTDDCVKRCEEGCSSHTPMDDCDDYDEHNKENDDSNDNNEFQSLCRQPSIITRPSRDEERCLPEDTFSFLIYSHVRSRAFFLATFVFSFQIAIYAVLAVNVIDRFEGRNPLKLPVYVDLSKRIAEFLSIVVAIITQDDVRKAVTLIRDGFDEDLVKAFEGATKAKWILSIVLRGSEGFLGLFLTFLLIVQAPTVLDLLLNFLAMEFVGQLDDVVFILTRERFFGRALKKDAMKVSNTFYRVSHLSTESKVASFVTAAYFILLFTVMFAGWGIIISRQHSGDFLCQQIFGQFGDEVVPMLGTFTGLFSRHERLYGGRLSYTDERDRVLLAYCWLARRWTISLSHGNYWDWDPCVNWIAASGESIDFDVLATANSQWVVRDAAKGILPLSQQFLACHEHNFCGKYGIHIDDIAQRDQDYGQCKCNPGHFGVQCEYSNLCQTLGIGPGDIGFVKTTDGTTSSYFASTYYRMEDVEVYNRPVYTSLLGNNQDVDVNLGENPVLSDETDIDIIIFTGVRWILSHKSLFPELTNVTDKKELAEYFSNFHGHFTNYTASYVSEPVYVSEALYYNGYNDSSQIGAEASLSNLGWQYSSAQQSIQNGLEKSSVETKFSCIVLPNHGQD